ncbi:peptide-methionine (S)-S-oxide reductase MsrA [Candidatus Pacearchaeota archaeon]|nr:peptide-methionine (S)-S-oxide reductase MsrA [Candidatus Pacearchaeota archaeon]
MENKIKTETAIFAAGCFWKPEDIFSKTPGVLKTQVGYIGGKMKNPTYQNVCSLNTGYVEATHVIFDPKKISYKKLLDIFWNIHNPTTKDRQGLDIGSQYNSMIFYHNEKQKKLAEKSKKERQKNMERKIVTQIKKAPKFWKAEEYHQKYVQKHGF